MDVVIVVVVDQNVESVADVVADTPGRLGDIVVSLDTEAAEVVSEFQGVISVDVVIVVVSIVDALSEVPKVEVVAEDAVDGTSVGSGVAVSVGAVDVSLGVGVKLLGMVVESWD